MQEYKVAKFWKIFLFITAPLMIALYVWGLFSPEFDIPYRVPICLAMITITILGVWDVIIAKITVTSEFISVKSLMKNKEMKLNEIKGFYIGGSRIDIVPKTAKGKALRIPNVHLIGKRDELKEWLIDNFTNLAGQR